MSNLLHYIDPEFLIKTVGLFGVIAVIFAESGLFFGFFLPGDSLLFTAGLFASQGYLPLYPLIIGCMIAAIVGDSVGYAFGRRAGPALFSKDDSLLFKKSHAEKARAFYERHGARTIFLARFVPVIRTFAPIVAGVGMMPYGRFLAWNIGGGVFWVALATLAGYFLGQAFPGIENHIETVALAIVAASCIPIAVEVLRNPRKRDSSTL
jgi:membrane-associated protein